MATYIVIGTSAFRDVSIVVGPYHSEIKAQWASRKLEHCGYVTEICIPQNVSDIQPLVGAADDY